MFEVVGSSIFASICTTGILVFLGKAWIEARLKASIEHEYNKQFELFQRELNQKQKVELVADLLAEYLRTPKGEVVPREQRTLLNRLSFQATLWLPSELAKELGKRLQNAEDAKRPADLLLVARRLLINDTSLTVNNVTLWPHTKEKAENKEDYGDEAFQ